MLLQEKKKCDLGMLCLLSRHVCMPWVCIVMGLNLPHDVYCMSCTLTHCTPHLTFMLHCLVATKRDWFEQIILYSFYWTIVCLIFGLIWVCLVPLVI